MNENQSAPEFIALGNLLLEQAELIVSRLECVLGELRGHVPHEAGTNPAPPPTSLGERLRMTRAALETAHKQLDEIQKLV